MTSATYETLQAMNLSESKSRNVAAERSMTNLESAQLVNQALELVLANGSMPA